MPPAPPGGEEEEYEYYGYYGGPPPCEIETVPLGYADDRKENHKYVKK